MTEEINEYVLKQPKRMKTVIMKNGASDLVKLEVFMDHTNKVVFQASLIEKGEKINGEIN